MKGNNKDIKNVLSLFNGMSGAKIGLDIAGIEVDKYYSSEIDKYANKVSNDLFPDTINLGDITQWQGWDIKCPDLIVAGSPCTNLSFAGKQKGLSTQCNIDITSLEQYQQLKSEGFNFEGQSYLFWEFIAIREHYKPKYFLIENVMFVKKWRDVFNKTIGFESDVINSALLSAQNRKRQYWLGKLNDDGSYSKIDISQPDDKLVFLKDIITEWNDITDRYNAKKIGTLSFYKSRKQTVNINDKSKVLMTGGQNISNSSATNISHNSRIYNPTPRECLRLQTVPEDIIDKMLDCGVSNTQIYKMCGNGFTCEVIAHILRHIK